MSFKSYSLDSVNLTDIKFDCGVNGLNKALFEEALSYHQRKYITTTLIKDGGKVIAYFSLMNDKVDLQEVQTISGNARRRMMPQYIRRELDYVIPAVKLVWLAVDKEYQHKGLATQILDDIKYQLINSISATAFIILDAPKERVDFYLKAENGFDYVKKDDEYEETRLLYFDLQKVK